MKIKSLDGKIYSLNLGQYIGHENTNASNLHIKSREFLHKNYPCVNILEEVYIVPEKIYLDFYIPILKICIESMGRQHLEYCIHFFPTKMDFYRAQARDNRKAEFCRINGITLIYFYEGEEESIWMKKMGLS